MVVRIVNREDPGLILVCAVCLSLCPATSVRNFGTSTVYEFVFSQYSGAFHNMNSSCGWKTLWILISWFGSTLFFYLRSRYLSILFRWNKIGHPFNQIWQDFLGYKTWISAVFVPHFSAMLKNLICTAKPWKCRSTPSYLNRDTREPDSVASQQHWTKTQNSHHVYAVWWAPLLFTKWKVE